MLQPCIPQDIGEDLHAGSPDVLVFREALCVPKEVAGLSRPGGLYDRSGRLILQAAQFHGHPSFRKTDQPLTVAPSSFTDRIFERVIYGGIISDHYGHFVTECLNTLWFAGTRRNQTEKILFLSHLPVDGILAIGWAARLLALCGITRERMIVVDRSTRVEELVVPGQAFSEDAFVYDSFGEFCALLGERAEPRDLPDGPVFLTKAFLKGGNLQIVNEGDLVEGLVKRGVVVVPPEQFDLDTQIAFRRNDRLVAGFVGSVFLTPLFLRSSRSIGLSLDARIRRSHHLVDAVCGARNDYLQVLDVEKLAERGAFNTSCRLNDPDRLAEEIVRVIAVGYGD